MLQRSSVFLRTLFVLSLDLYPYSHSPSFVAVVVSHVVAVLSQDGEEGRKELGELERERTDKHGCQMAIARF